MYSIEHTHAMVALGILSTALAQLSGQAVLHILVLVGTSHPVHIWGGGEAHGPRA